MIRAALILAFLAAALVAAAAVQGEPGRASVEWLGWRLDTTAVAAAVLILVGGLLALVFWRIFAWILTAPRRAARARADDRRRQAQDLLARGFLAAAGGDGAEARRCAIRAADLSEDNPALVRVLTAQAAEAQGDPAGARAAYAAMLGFPEMRVAGHRGLMQTALAQGDREAALKHAEAAYGLAKGARWAWQALLEARLSDGDWAAALELNKGALQRRIVPPLVAERTRAALLAASAADKAGSPDPKARAQALDQALEAARLRPGFAPGVVMAGRLLAENGKPERAAKLVQEAWAEAPHPALWLAYRDLETAETPRERAERLRDLAGRNPAHRESRMLMVEQALIANDARAALEGLAALDDEPPTARTCALMARAARAAGQMDEARAWVGRAGAAPQEPDWSDLDPEGRAFAYTPSDWARLVAVYAETGELVHPRHERRERVLSDIPDLPAGYHTSMPFLRAAEAGRDAPAPLPDDPGAADDGLDPDDPETTASGAPPAAPRRARVGAKLRRG
jgi:HemY protein